MSNRLDKIVEDLKTVLLKTWDLQAREYLMTLLDFAAMSDTLTSADVDHIGTLAEDFLGTGLEQAARRPVIGAVDSAYSYGKMLGAIDFSLKAPDIMAMRALHSYSFFWVGNAYSRFVSQDIQAMIREYFDKGLTRLQLAEGMSIMLRDHEKPKMRGYFELLADHLTTKVAELGHLAGYEDAGVESVEIVARLDERTTEICRHLHGRVIPIQVLADQRDRILDAAKKGDMEGVKKAQPMLSGRRADAIMGLGKTSEITAQGIGLPPYHFRCRTTTVAHFRPADYWERTKQWAIDGEVPKNEVPKLLDAARNAHWGTHKQILPKRYGGDGKPHSSFMAHALRHGHPSELNMTPAEYNQAAINLIRRADRDAYLVVVDKRHPYPVLYFHDPKTREFAVVNVKGRQIATYHILEQNKFLEKLRDKCEIALHLGAKGVMKWTRRFAG